MADPVRESQLRAALRIPPDAASVVILAQNSHLDWDWNETFRGYLETGLSASVVEILTSAFALMRKGGGADAQIPYYYSIAEVGFLKAFAEEHPEEVRDFAEQIGERLRIVGGGITSADNLLPHGEAFLRNYLLGAAWAHDVLGLPIREAWIPDDFGHDAQLPVLVRALGFKAAAFGRLPGWNNGGSLAPGSPADQVMCNGTDFFWQATDGSTILGHYLQFGYCQWGFYDGDLEDALAEVERCYAQNARNSGTAYVFVPVGCDFSCPVDVPGVGDLRDIAAQWNQRRYAQDPAGSPYAVAAPFDFYVDLLLAASWKRPSPPQPFHPTPFLTGFYASRPENKIRHRRATRALLAAEVFGLLADSAAGGTGGPTAAGRQRDLSLAWSDLAPSTHHDYVTGTSKDAVYSPEQLPLLGNAVTVGEALRDLALGQIAARVDVSGQGAAMPVVIANALGWERGGVAELEGVPYDGSFGGQGTAEGGTLLSVDAVPGFAYVTETLEGGGSVDTARITESADSFVLSNGLLAATIATSGGDWGLTSLTDTAGGGAEVFGTPANELVFYDDAGSIYNFWHENFYCEHPGRSFDTLRGVAFGGHGATVLERGPLRVRLRTWVETHVAGATFRFEREFTVVAGEPFVRVRATGSAPSRCSVGITLPVPAGTSGLEYGTTYHWDDAGALEGWVNPSPEFCVPPVFQALHDFVVPLRSETPAFAVYTDGLMAWSLYQEEGCLLAIPWRNNPDFDGHASCGTDSSAHTHRYAIRVPTGLAAASTGGPLRESRAMQTPLAAGVVSAPSDGALSPRGAVAGVESVGDGACVLLTAAKVGTRDPSALVLRFYKPTNGVHPTVEVSVNPAVLGAPGDAGSLSVRGVTALETDLPDEENAALRISTTAESFTFTATSALTTLAVSAGPARVRPPGA